jgi:hypothetical protein
MTEEQRTLKSYDTNEPPKVTLSSRIFLFFGKKGSGVVSIARITHDAYDALHIWDSPGVRMLKGDRKAGNPRYGQLFAKLKAKGLLIREALFGTTTMKNSYFSTTIARESVTSPAVIW